MEAAEWTCRYCGAIVHDWSEGYWLDRVDSKLGYLESNVHVCCYPCNWTKSNRNAADWRREIDRLVKKWGRGKVPWQEIDPRFRRAVPDLTPFVVMQSKQLPLFNAEQRTAPRARRQVRP